MITEKTVELNLTTELINFLEWDTRLVHFSLAPGSQQESQLGFDTSVVSAGGGLLVQYKRAYVDGDIWSWRLNRTTRKDQHQRLLNLEQQGYPVFYAFPYFHTPGEIFINRHRLLLYVAWYQPSQITFNGNMNEHHDVCFDEANKRWYTTSEKEHEIDQPGTIDDVLMAYADSLDKDNLQKFMNDFNQIYYQDLETNQESNDPAAEIEELNRGLHLIAGNIDAPEVEAEE